MNSNGVTLNIAYTPIKHSWYHYFCFSNTLTYALRCFLPFALEYIAVKESMYRVEVQEEYPFVKIEYQDRPDENIKWCLLKHTEPSEIRNSLRNGIPVIALRDLYDVASFNRHFGRNHHPNWYLIYGFEGHKFFILAEEGQRIEKLDARCYRTLKITEKEVAFTGDRVKKIFLNIYQFPHYPAITAEPHITKNELNKQIEKVQATFRTRSNTGDPIDVFIEKLQLGLLDVDIDAFKREECFIRTWGMKLRALQVLGAACSKFDSIYEPACEALANIDPLLASSIFWKLQLKHSRFSSKRLRDRQLFVARCLRKIRDSEQAIAHTLSKIKIIV